jgi:L-ascorbate metabolism protein UlaG (beta-lactamase superfamily)
MRIETKPGGVRHLWKAELNPNAIGLAWLGQAGFALRFGALRMLIDPYLSNSLADKYRGGQYDHVRQMPAPMQPDEIDQLDFVLCSHRHTDHMDPGSLPAFAANNRRCRFVVPAAERDAAINAGIPGDRVELVNASHAIELGPDAMLHVLPAAHEKFEINERGEHHFLGFIFRLGKITLYHSGDTIPFVGQPEAVKTHSTNLALLPINGRDKIRTSRGIVGNMTFEEAYNLCVAAKVEWMIPHHFGLFEFNTVDQPELERKVAAAKAVKCIMPRIEDWYLLRT